MNNIRISLLPKWLLIAALLPISCTVSRQPKDPALRALSKKIEQAPNDASQLEAYLQLADPEEESTRQQFDRWMQKFPKSSAIPYAIGQALVDKESPKAKHYLLKTIALDSTLTEVWGSLWIDAERWGDQKLGQHYLQKAVQSAPENDKYFFYYASSLRETDWASYVQKSIEVGQRFPNSERGAQALYWLAHHSKDRKDKMHYLELLKNKFDPKRYNWSSSGMLPYLDLLLEENPQKALHLTNEMALNKEEDKSWSKYQNIVKDLLHATTLIDEQNPMAAKAILDTIKLPRYFDYNKHLAIKRAECLLLAGDTAASYESLIAHFCKEPSLTVFQAIQRFGRKSDEQLRQDIYRQLDVLAEPATSFELADYSVQRKKISLKDYDGKVVLLTYWFPGCGPCRGEFPHFENVVRKFSKADLAYVGINISPEQQEYVVPFMTGTGYSFTPIEDTKDRVKGNLDNQGAAPVNFLIDKRGHKVFSNFRTDGNNEEDLELMIDLLLKRI